MTPDKPETLFTPSVEHNEQSSVVRVKLMPNKGRDSANKTAAYIASRSLADLDLIDSETFHSTVWLIRHQRDLKEGVLVESAKDDVELAIGFRDGENPFVAVELRSANRDRQELASRLADSMRERIVKVKNHFLTYRSPDFEVGSDEFFNQVFTFYRSDKLAPEDDYGETISDEDIDNLFGS